MSNNPVPKGIFEVKQYGIEGGKTITVLQPLDGSKPTFIGDGAIMVINGDRPARVPFQFHIEAGTIEEAFEKMEEEGKKKVPEIKREIEKKMREAQSQIILPYGSGNGPSRL